MTFTTKDSGKRKQFASGMVRDTEDGKIDYTYCLQGPMLDRWAQLMERGAKKYDRDNWMKANGAEELERFRTSALRHLIQWLRGDGEEDHAAACLFNINGAEYVQCQIEQSTLAHTTSNIENGSLQDHPPITERTGTTRTRPSVVTITPKRNGVLSRAGRRRRTMPLSKYSVDSVRSAGR
jgi:hypothetical protein